MTQIKRVRVPCTSGCGHVVETTSNVARPQCRRCRKVQRAKVRAQVHGDPIAAVRVAAESNRAYRAQLESLLLWVREVHAPVIRQMIAEVSEWIDDCDDMEDRLRPARGGSQGVQENS